MPRARGRGTGRGRGRGRAVTSPVAVNPIADGLPERRAAFEARKAELMGKALDLSVMEDAAVAVVCSGIDGLGSADYWPSVEAARAVAELFHKLPEGTRSTWDHASYVVRVRDAQRSKLAEVRAGGIAAVLGPWDRELDGMSAEALRELLASIEASQKTTRGRIRELQPQPDESVAENSAVGEEAASPASGEVLGKLKQLPGDDDADSARMKHLAEDHKEKPEPASWSAAPYDAGMIEYINVGGYVMERDAYDFIRFDLGMFPPSLEPESPDYDEPLRLWSWDSSSFPHGAPPPPPPK